jgi:FtsP/CotA-like multicopper oxidase with cupredoxin domain
MPTPLLSPNARQFVHALGSRVTAVVTMVAAALVVQACAARTPDTATAPPLVVANDNRAPAGTLRDGVLSLNLEIVTARWYPQAADGPFIDLPVFAEVGKAPSVPAPLIRVPQGTRVRVTVRNRLPANDVGLWGPGLATGNDSSTVPLASGATRVIEYTADHAGSFMYGARSRPLDTLAIETEQLAGGIVVDEPGARIDDRVFVVNIWYEPGPNGTFNNVYALNGRSWPNTEPLTATQGDSLSWRVLNPTIEAHPMHLHGAYFRVDARGDTMADTLYTEASRRMAVTEIMKPRTTMRLTWSPATPGNWLFHCHNAYHVSSQSRLNGPSDTTHEMHSTDPRKHMGGLVMGIAVRPRETQVARTNVRVLSAVIAQGTARDTAHVAPITLQLVPNGRTSVSPPTGPRGALVLLTRGEPTDLTVHNALDQPTAIHWHGLELESWSDGVAGVSGVGTNVAPAIAPRDSFVARLTLKRAGTFIYHTHLNDHAQLSAGLYGPLVVLPPGTQWDPTRDFVFTAGLDETAIKGPAVNGARTEAPVTLHVGTFARFRFVNIQPEEPAQFDIARDKQSVSWRPVAKDGFELPQSQSVTGAASRELWPGETFDAEFAPTAPGTYVLRMRTAKGDVAYTRSLMVVR